MSFYEKVKVATLDFLESEELIRSFIDEKNFDMALGLCSEIFKDLFVLDFEIGFNGEKYELIFSTLNSKERIYELVYLKDHFPLEIFDYWNIIIGSRPMKNIEIKMYDITIGQGDVLVYIKNNHISLYSKKIVPLLKNNIDAAYEIMAILLKNTIGDIPFMKYIDGVDILPRPKLFNKMSLTDLPSYFENLYGTDIYRAEDIIESYSVYQSDKAVKSDIANRKDIIFGSTAFLRILRGEKVNFDDGIEFGYIAFPIDSNKEIEDILTFKNDLEKEIKNTISLDYGLCVGDGMGINYCYYDLIVWDKERFLDALELLKEKVGMESIVYCDFEKLTEK